TRPFVQLDEAHIVALHARAERRSLGERHDRVPPALARQAVQQVDDAVLEPADVEAVDDVRDQRAGIDRTHLDCLALVSIAEIDGHASCTNDCSVAAAASPSVVYTTTSAESSPWPVSFDHAIAAFAHASFAVRFPSIQYHFHARNTRSASPRMRADTIVRVAPSMATLADASASLVHEVSELRTSTLFELTSLRSKSWPR